MSDITPSQTVGPFFAYGLTPKGRCEWDPNGQYSWKETVGDNLVTHDASGQRIHIEGRVTDGDGEPINDAMIEIWQADAQGRYANPRDNRALPNAAFKGFGRSATDKNGVYSFETIKPGQAPGPNGKTQAPHIVVCVYSRGMLRQVYTRLYFEDEVANADDPILVLVPADRRGTLIARREKNARSGTPAYRFDIRVQGDNETVFFDI
ncbi:MAG TPA: protocatechuate 3,4-dioxygenase subunit alpha [Pseudolabrys sp.]|nr:protocatechuate 3,4-dioxygenase subunit alpha [Pseudolabrys sp.]